MKKKEKSTGSVQNTLSISIIICKNKKPSKKGDIKREERKEGKSDIVIKNKKRKKKVLQMLSIE